MHPEIISIGPITIYSYGLLMAIAFFIGIQLCVKTAEKKGISPKKMTDLCLLLLISGIAGARLGYVLSNIGFFIENPKEIIMLNHGGLFFFGGLLTALFCGILYLKLKKEKISLFADIICKYMPMGQALGRIGCFLNGCCWGKACDIDAFSKLSPDKTNPLHPVQIYESILSIILLCILHIIYRKNLKSGTTALTYLCGYSFIRFCMEFFRGDHEIVFSFLTGWQLLCISIFIPSLSLLIRKIKR